MKKSPTGTFTPLYRVNPDPSEGDWSAPTDLPSEEDIEQAQLSSSHLGKQNSTNKRLSNLQVQKSSISGVGPALKYIISELETEIVNMNVEGARLFSLSQYEEAAKKAEAGKVFHSFLKKIKSINENWHQISSSNEARNLIHKPSNKISSKSVRKRSSRKFSVFLDGREIVGKWGGDVFANCIAEMGITDVRNLNIIKYGEPIISSSASNKYASLFRDGFYVMTHFNSEDKKSILTSIADSLNRSIVVHISK